MFLRLLALCLVICTGCSEIAKPEIAGTGEAKKEVKAETSNPSESAVKKISKIVKIVFVGQDQACECTRERIDNTWKTLQDAMKNWATIDIERIQRDVDVETAQRYNDMQPIMVAPGLYFLDDREVIIEFLQGELTEKQIEEAILSKGL